MKQILIILLCLWGTVQAQTTGYLRYDSVRIEKGGGNGELILLNGTRGVTNGVLTNIGNGRTQFKTPTTGVDSVTVSGDSICYWKGGVSVCELLPSTGGSTNTSVGSAYKIAVDGTNDIKSLGQGWGVILDSATTGQVGVKADTTSGKIATQTMLGAKVDTVKIYGNYLTSTIPGASIPAGFLKLDGAATITFNNPGVTYTGGTGSKSDNYIRNTDTSSSNNYDYVWEFTLNTKFTAYAGQGKWFGKQSLDNTTIYNGIVYFGYGGSSSLARMKLAMVNGTGNGTAVDSSGTITMANGSDYRLTFSQRWNVFYIKLARVVSGQEVEAVYIDYRVSLATATVLPNIGVASFGSLDGTSEIKVTNFKINYNDIINPKAVVIGTSISQGVGATSMNNHWIPQAFRGSGHTWANLSSGGMNFLDGLPILPRAERLNPDYYIIELGANDIGGGAAVFRAYLQAYYDTIVTTYGKQMIVLKTFSDPDADTVYYNFCGEKNILLIDPKAVMTSADFIAPGDLHPNDNGENKIAASCKQALPSLFGTEQVNDQYSLKGLNDVVITNSTLADNDVLTYSSALGKWQNESVSGQLVILQPGAITQQTGSFGVTGYGEVGTGLAVGAVNEGGVTFKVSGNTANDVTTKFENLNTAGTYNFGRISQFGVTAYGVADWPSATVFTAFGNGGLVLGSYAGSIKFQVGTSYTTRGTWSTTGLDITGTLTTGGVNTLTNLAGTGTRVVTASAAGLLAATDAAPTSSTYTPTLFNTTNVSSSTPIVCHYIRVGNEVSYSGSATITTTAGSATASVLGISLPIASNFAATTNATGNGTSTAPASFTTAAYIEGSVANDRLELKFDALSAATGTIFFSGHYTIIP